MKNGLSHLHVLTKLEFSRLFTLGADSIDIRRGFINENVFMVKQAGEKLGETKLKRFLHCRACQSIYHANMQHKPL